MTSASAQSAVGSALSTCGRCDDDSAMSRFAHGASSLKSTVPPARGSISRKPAFCFPRPSVLVAVSAAAIQVAGPTVGSGLEQGNRWRS